MDKPHVVILGGGPAGCGAAYYLTQQNRARVTLVERQAVVGGNAGTFLLDGQHLDYGSHRLHHACDPEILSDIKRLLGDDLLDRTRHGRIRLRDKWIHFPLQMTDVLLRLDRRFALGVIGDLVMRKIAPKGAAEETFDSVLMANLGATICRGFYFPYARKIWGLEPRDLSAIQARKRVSAGTFTKLLKRLITKPGGGKFFYPRFGFGQITTGFADAAVKNGADLRLGSEVICLEPPTDRDSWRISTQNGGERQTIEADYVWSTIPITIAAHLVKPSVPSSLLNAIGEISYRAMLLVYLQLDVDRFSATDAHYFPESDISMTRLSEPKNYSGADEPVGRTTLCAEIPCDMNDNLWKQSDVELGRLVVADMRRAGLRLQEVPLGVVVKRLKQAYPIYTKGYEEPFQLLDSWANTLPNFLSYGRQGLFAHDNTHHALSMASAAATCLAENSFDNLRWSAYRKIFAEHVVED